MSCDLRYQAFRFTSRAEWSWKVWGRGYMWCFWPLCSVIWNRTYVNSPSRNWALYTACINSSKKWLLVQAQNYFGIDEDACKGGRRDTCTCVCSISWSQNCWATTSDTWESLFKGFRSIMGLATEGGYSTTVWPEVTAFFYIVRYL